MHNKTLVCYSNDGSYSSRKTAVNSGNANSPGQRLGFVPRLPLSALIQRETDTAISTSVSEGLYVITRQCLCVAGGRSAHCKLFEMILKSSDPKGFKKEEPGGG